MQGGGGGGIREGAKKGKEVLKILGDNNIWVPPQRERRGKRGKKLGRWKQQTAS